MPPDRITESSDEGGGDKTDVGEVRDMALAVWIWVQAVPLVVGGIALAYTGIVAGEPGFGAYVKALLVGTGVAALGYLRLRIGRSLLRQERWAWGGSTAWLAGFWVMQLLLTTAGLLEEGWVGWFVLLAHPLWLWDLWRRREAFGVTRFGRTGEAS